MECGMGSMEELMSDGRDEALQWYPRSGRRVRCTGRLDGQVGASHDFSVQTATFMVGSKAWSNTFRRRVRQRPIDWRQTQAWTAWMDFQAVYRLP
jgi:hypothetical protein